MSDVPTVVFIVPYRNRHQHKNFFCTYLTSILPENLKYEVYFSHQWDIRSFNRGGTKNIGFLAHEVQEVFSFLVEGTKDGPETQSLNYIGLIGILTKEIQDLKKRVKKLED